VTPSLFQLKPEEMVEICDREVTGPLLTLAVVDDLDQGVELVNSSPDRLLMSVFCRSERALSRVRALQNTALCLQNLPTTHHLARLPFQPSGTSSNGLATGTLTARTCSRVVVNIGRDDALDVTMLPPGLPRGF
jgi:acyl-CoA reductase-like NAD-dependent aldehyde dehydrogenase